MIVFMVIVLLVGVFVLKLMFLFYGIGVGNLLFGLGLGGFFLLVLFVVMNIDSDNGLVFFGIFIIGNFIGV